MRSAEPNALVLTINWDIYSPILYLKYIEKTRTDVALVDKELLRRSWYFKYLREQYPWLIQGSKQEVESYLVLLDEFEAGTLKDNNEIQRRYLAMINSFIVKALSERPPRPVYLTFDRAMDSDYPGIAPALNKVPCGLLYRVFPGDSVFPSNPAYELRGVFEPGIGKDDRTAVNLMNYPRMAYERGMFLAAHGRYAEAVGILKGLLDWPINRAMVLKAMGGCELAMGELDEAQSAFEEMLREDPSDPVAKSGLEEIRRRRHAAPGGGK
jgi:tetratricopeptide (TPR) repeat protein